MASTFSILAFFFFPVLMISASICDVTTMRIPNKLVLVLLFGYAACAPLSGLSLFEIATSMLAAVTVFCLAFGAFACGWMGGGDVKLMAATALWLGLPQLPAFLFWTSLFGALLTLTLLLYRAVPLPESLKGYGDWVSHLHQRTTRVPYGAAIGPAALLVFASTPWMTALRAL